ncbi:MAG: hypothetical protein QOC96_120 [Acidobacteriota bacterium]|nr:hypothetical protein [Acidobacteriota bacterium]
MKNLETIDAGTRRRRDAAKKKDISCQFFFRRVSVSPCLRVPVLLRLAFHLRLKRVEALLQSFGAVACVEGEEQREGRH